MASMPTLNLYTNYKKKEMIKLFKTFNIREYRKRTWKLTGIVIVVDLFVIEFDLYFFYKVKREQNIW